jgi:hypothetical protein
MGKIVGEKFGQAEIEDFSLTAFGHEYVGGLDVSMDDACGVCDIERVGNLNSKFKNLLDGKSPAMDVLTESFTVNEFHGDERMVILFANVINGADTGMIESGSSVGFTAETLQGLGVLLHVIWEEFQRHEAIKASVQGLVDDTHSASTEFVQDAIVRDGPVNHWRARRSASTIQITRSDR